MRASSSATRDSPRFVTMRSRARSRNSWSTRAPGTRCLKAGPEVGKPVDWARLFAQLGDGICVWGVPGPMLLVTGNSTQTVNVGIRIVQVGPIPDRCLCEVTQNVAFQVMTPIDPHGTVNVAADNVPTP